jgi:hypothetical protein
MKRKTTINNVLDKILLITITAWYKMLSKKIYKNEFHYFICSHGCKSCLSPNVRRVSYKYLAFLAPIIYQYYITYYKCFPVETEVSKLLWLTCLMLYLYLRWRCLRYCRCRLTNSILVGL